MNRWLLFLLFIMVQQVFAVSELNYGVEFKHFSNIFEAERRYMVSLPEGYQSSRLTYPSLFIMDGDFQFHHVANTVKHLARMGKIPAMIVIGVANQGPADYVYSNTWKLEGEAEYGGASKAIQYLHTELVPFIDKTYRTDSRKALAGYSLGGLFVLSDFVSDKTPFSAFIAMSPSVWFDEYQFKEKLKSYLQSHKQLNRHLFLSVANERGMGVRDLLPLLEDSKQNKLHWEFKNYPNETHYSTALPALYDALQFLAPDYFMDMGQLMEIHNSSEVIDRLSAKRSLWTGFQLSWLQSYTLGKYLFASGQEKNIPEFISSAKKLFPESVNELIINLALGYNRNNKPKEAIRLLQSIRNEELNNEKWYYQMSVAYEHLNEKTIAMEYHTKAIALAQKYGIDSWAFWELEPNKYKLSHDQK